MTTCAAPRTRKIANVFVKPDDQSDACISFGMARKGRMKSNVGCKPVRVSIFRVTTCAAPRTKGIVQVSPKGWRTFLIPECKVKGELRRNKRFITTCAFSMKNSIKAPLFCFLHHLKGHSKTCLCSSSDYHSRIFRVAGR